jgi:hypothetical protein
MELLIQSLVKKEEGSAVCSISSVEVPGDGARVPQELSFFTAPVP